MSNIKFKAALCALSSMVVLAYCSAANAEISPEIEARLARLESLLAAQDEQISEQAVQLMQQRRLLNQRRDQAKASDFEQTVPISPFLLDRTRGLGEPTDGSNPPTHPVGEAPPAAEVRVSVPAAPVEASVLTPRHGFSLEPSVDYTYSGSNILVFRGVEIVPGVQLGVIEASDTVRSAESVALTARYGLTRRVEVEARLPYIWRADRIGVVQQRDAQVRREISLADQDIGDVEFAARYQLNRVQPNRPVFIAAIRAKTNTGSSPFTVTRDSFGVATHLATGSGYWTYEPNLTMIYPSDPAVFFLTGGLMLGQTTNINRTIDGIFIRKVIPGGSLSMSMGYGFAVNQRFSYSVAYRHSYLMPNEIKIGDTKTRSKSVQVGIVSVGVSYRLSDRLTLSPSFEFGTTPDASDTHISFRLPMTF